MSDHSIRRASAAERRRYPWVPAEPGDRARWARFGSAVWTPTDLDVSTGEVSLGPVAGAVTVVASRFLDEADPDHQSDHSPDSLFDDE